MTYGDLLPAEITAKLIATSFDDPSVNLGCFKLYKALSEHQEFFENERNKLIVKYGEPIGEGRYQLEKINLELYKESLNKLASMEVDGDIPYFELSEDNFSTERCQYSQSKSMWLSAVDINSVLMFLDKLKDRG